MPSADLTVDEFRAVRRFLPEEAYEVVADEIAHIQNQPPIGFLSLGLAVSLWLVSNLFATVIDGLNRIQGTHETRPYWRLTLTAIALTAIEVVIVLGAPDRPGHLAPDSRLARLEQRGTRGTNHRRVVCRRLRDLLSFSVTFNLGPNIRPHWSWLTPGALLGTLAFLASCLILHVYVQYFANYSKTYGSLAGVMILLFWFWIAAVILLVAYQINKIIEEEHRSDREMNWGRTRFTSPSPVIINVSKAVHVISATDRRPRRAPDRRRKPRPPTGSASA